MLPGSAGALCSMTRPGVTGGRGRAGGLPGPIEAAGLDPAAVLTAARASWRPGLDDGGEGGHRCRGGELAAVLTAARASWRRAR